MCVRVCGRAMPDLLACAPWLQPCPPALVEVFLQVVRPRLRFLVLDSVHPVRIAVIQDQYPRQQRRPPLAESRHRILEELSPNGVIRYEEFCSGLIPHLALRSCY
jgi:hypothetical protein